MAFILTDNSEEYAVLFDWFIVHVCSTLLKIVDGS